MCCRILDPDWSFEVADDGYVHATKQYLISDSDYLFSPYQLHRPQTLIVESDRKSFNIEMDEGYAVYAGIHSYLNQTPFVGMDFNQIRIPIRIKPEDIIMVGAFGDSDSIVSMKVELIEKFTLNDIEYYLKKTKNGLMIND